MTTSEFEILTGKTPMMLGTKVSKKLRAGWELHGNTWSTGQNTSLEFHQAVMKRPTGIKKESRSGKWWD